MSATQTVLLRRKARTRFIIVNGNIHYGASLASKATSKQKIYGATVCYFDQEAAKKLIPKLKPFAKASSSDEERKEIGQLIEDDQFYTTSETGMYRLLDKGHITS